MSGAKRGGRRPEPRADESEKDIFKHLLLQEVGGNMSTVRIIDEIFAKCDDMDDTIVELIGTIEPDLLDQKMEEAKKIYSDAQKRRQEEEQKQQQQQRMMHQYPNVTQQTYNQPRPQVQAAPMQRTMTDPYGRDPREMAREREMMQAPREIQRTMNEPYGRDPRAMSRESTREMVSDARELPEPTPFGALSKASSRMSVKNEMQIKEEASAGQRHVSEPSGRHGPEPLSKMPTQASSQDTAMQIEQQIDYGKLQQQVQLNHDRLKKKLRAKFETMKKTKGFTPAFLENLHWAFMIYMGNILRELVKISAIEYDADFKLFAKEIEGEETANPHMFDKRNERVVLTDLGDPETDAQILETGFYLVKSSHLQEDQKVIDDLDAKEKDRIALETSTAIPQSSEMADEKITKKVKKEENDYTELVKHLFKSRTDKEKDPESGDKKIEEANKQLMNVMFGTKTVSVPGSKTVAETPLVRDNSVKGKKNQPQRRKISLKHLIYYLENSHHYKRSKYLQEAYFDTSLQTNL